MRSQDHALHHSASRGKRPLDLPRNSETGFSVKPRNTGGGAAAHLCGLFLVGGEPLPERDALVGRQRGKLVERAVDLTDAVVARVAVVVEKDDLQSPTGQLRRRHVEHEFLLELRAQRAPVNATLKPSAAPLRQQTQATERVRGAARIARNQISSLYATGE